MIPVTYRGKKPINFTGHDKIHSKCDCINDSVVNGVREPVLFGFALDKPPGHKKDKEARINLLEKIINLFYLISHFLRKRMITNGLILMEERYPLLAN